MTTPAPGPDQPDEPTPRYTPDEMAERARQAFAPPVQSRDVDAEPRFRNDSDRWTDCGYPR